MTRSNAPYGPSRRQSRRRTSQQRRVRHRQARGAARPRRASVARHAAHARKNRGGLARARGAAIDRHRRRRRHSARCARRARQTGRRGADRAGGPRFRSDRRRQGEHPLRRHQPQARERRAPEDTRAGLAPTPQQRFQATTFACRRRRRSAQAALRRRRGCEVSDKPSPRSETTGLEITAGQLASDERLGVRLKRVAGEAGLARPIRHPRIQKSGLALAGHYYGVVPTRVQVLGGTELSYLDKLDPNARGAATRAYFALGLSCVVLTRDEPQKALVAAAEATGTPLFVSDNRSSRTINALHALLDERLAPQAKLHGVLVDVFGIGVLLLGKSGIGKSECALELVLRGHRLVADDVVQCD